MTAQAIDSPIDQAFTDDYVGEPWTEEEIREFEQEYGSLDFE